MAGNPAAEVCSGLGAWREGGSQDSSLGAGAPGPFPTRTWADERRELISGGSRSHGVLQPRSPGAASSLGPKRQCKGAARNHLLGGLLSNVRLMLTPRRASVRCPALRSHRRHPLPSPVFRFAVRTQLAQQLGVDARQVQIWFQVRAAGCTHEAKFWPPHFGSALLVRKQCPIKAGRTQLLLLRPRPCRPDATPRRRPCHTADEGFRLLPMGRSMHAVCSIL